MSDEKIKTSINIPKYHYNWLKIWAYFKGRGTTTLAQDIIQARIEANREEISLMLESRANDLSLTPAQLIDKILKEDE